MCDWGEGRFWLGGVAVRLLFAYRELSTEKARGRSGRGVGTGDNAVVVIVGADNERSING